MDAGELMEWLAYRQLQDPEYKTNLEYKMACEKSENEKNNALRRLLMGI